MTAVYNHPCNGFNNTSDDGGSRLDFGWISPPPSALLQEGSGFTCRRESQSVVFPTEKSGSVVTQKAAESDKSERDGDVKMREDIHEKMCQGLKRKLETNSENCAFSSPPPPKRISPFLNTPKERKEERRKVLKISIQKLKQVEDPEHFLRRSVLINNTLKKVQKEMREEKKRHRYSRGFSRGYSIYRLRPSYDYDVLNNSYLSSSNAYYDMFEDPFGSGENDKITDDMTEMLENSLEAHSYNSATSQCNAPSSPSSSQTQATESSSSSPSSILSSGETVVDESDNLTQRERQICADMDVVFNNLIRTLGET
ncbi:hypothetical protein ScPMuIL_014111 [Solemya velum]